MVASYLVNYFLKGLLGFLLKPQLILTVCQLFVDLLPK